MSVWAFPFVADFFSLFTFQCEGQSIYLISKMFFEEIRILQFHFWHAKKNSFQFLHKKHFLTNKPICPVGCSTTISFRLWFSLINWSNHRKVRIEFDRFSADCLLDLQ